MLFNLFSNKQSENTAVHFQNKIIIYQSELDYLSKCILESPQIETGGNLFGLWTPFGIPFIHYVVGPGPNAIHNPTHFRQDYNFLERNADLLVEEHALHHIGSWHSHHSLGLDHPSPGDSESTFSGMQECKLSSFILLIGNYRKGKSTINAFRYFSNGTFVKLKWVILKGTSPIRSVYDKLHPNFVYTPSGIANMGTIEECRLIDNKTILQQSPVFQEDYWLSIPENKKEFAEIVKYLKSKFEGVSIYQINNTTIELHITDSGYKFRFVFDETFPREAPKLLAPKELQTEFQSRKTIWSIENKSISNAFIHYVNTIKL